MSDRLARPLRVTAVRKIPDLSHFDTVINT